MLPAVILLFACRQHNFDVQVPADKVHISIDRFDQELFSADPAQTDSLIAILQDRYGSFFELFTQRIIAIGDTGSPHFRESLKAFITNYDNYSVYQKVQQVYPNLAPTEEKLTGAFRRFLYYYPDQKVPRIISFVSGFNYSVVSDSDLLGIGLDKYLGSDEELYSRAGIYSR